MARIQCPKHGLDLGGVFACQKCRDEYTANFQERLRAQGFTGAVTVSLPPMGEQHQVLVNGVLRDIYHDGTYIETSVPEALYDELTALIEARVAAFKDACACATCEVERESKRPTAVEDPAGWLADLQNPAALRALVYVLVRRYGGETRTCVVDCKEALSITNKDVGVLRYRLVGDSLELNIRPADEH